MRMNSIQYFATVKTHTKKSDAKSVTYLYGSTESFCTLTSPQLPLLTADCLSALTLADVHMASAYFLLLLIYHFRTWTLGRQNLSTHWNCYRKPSEAQVWLSTRRSRVLPICSWAVTRPSTAPLPGAGDGWAVRDDESAPVRPQAHPHLGFRCKKGRASPSLCTVLPDTGDTIYIALGNWLIRHILKKISKCNYDIV